MSWRSFAVVAALLVIVAPAMAGGDDQSIQDLRAEIAALQAKVEAMEIGAMADRTATLERAVADLAADVEENSFSSNVSAPFLRAIDLSGSVRMQSSWDQEAAGSDWDLDTRLTVGANATVSDSVAIYAETMVTADFDAADTGLTDEWTQLYVDMANMAGTGWSARIGRQELSIGSELVVGNEQFDLSSAYGAALDAITLNGDFGGRASGTVFFIDEDSGDNASNWTTGIHAGIGAVEGYDVSVYWIDDDDEADVKGLEAAGALGGMAFTAEFADQDNDVGDGGDFWEVGFDVNLGDYAGGLADQASISTLHVTIDSSDSWTDYSTDDMTDRYYHGTFMGHSPAATTDHWSVSTTIAGIGVTWHDFTTSGADSDGYELSYATDALGIPATFYYQKEDAATDQTMLFFEASLNF